MSGIVIDETTPNMPRDIKSEASGRGFYRSDFVLGDMKLKGRFCQGHRTATHYNRHSDNNNPNRHKLPNPTSYAEPRVMVADVAKGRTRMMSRAQFAALPWGWEIT